jgi:hypothetical protein
MWSADTLAHLNAIEDLKVYILKHRPRRVFKVDDVRNSPDFARVDVAALCKAFDAEHVETLFVDTSGFGSPDEPALTYSQCQVRIAGILADKKPGERFYSVLSGIGQFQVYLTILKKGGRR